MRLRVAAAGVVLVFTSSTLCAQQIDLGESNAAARSKRQHVELLSDKIDITGERPQDIDVIFRVDPGFHINSHQPKDELLIPTALKLADTTGLRVLSERYPDGAPFEVKVGSETEHLDVYTAEFRVVLRIAAPKGLSTVRGLLHYQACDSAACFPPRDLPVTLTFSAK